MVAATVTELGRLDVLGNNAAVQMSGRLVDCTEDEWTHIATNLNAIFWACRARRPSCSPATDRSSTRHRPALIGSEGYAATGRKAGLVALTRQIAVEYGPTVRQRHRFGSIDAALPPRDRTARRPGTLPRDARRPGPAQPRRHRGRGGGDRVVLASDAPAYTSGAVIPCDGGLAAMR
jgi:NAD(P)-dependent dehydrogenase (short-subunit alcohol dehydrogenase family)